jgi:hypothetical protein
LSLILDLPGIFDIVESGLIGERDIESGVGPARDIGDVG